MPSLVVSRDREILHDGARVFDAAALVWKEPEGPLPEGEAVSATEAVRWLHGRAETRRIPVGIIGPREATAAQTATAERLGRALGGLGVVILNGGKTGVMEAVSKGCTEAGGLVIGLIPDEDWRQANPYVGIPLATGIGPARNVLIARASRALVAIGGEYGTLSEMAFGLHFDKPVFTLEGAPVVEGAQRMDSVEEVVDAVAEVILGLAP